MEVPAGRRRYLILHGWQGNGPGHWQTWLADRLRDRGEIVRYPVLPDHDAPELPVWLSFLEGELDRFEGAPSVVVCHSLAVILWLHHAARVDRRQAESVVLVAPPSPNLGIEEMAGFFPAPLDSAAVARAAERTVLVHADDDPYCPEGAGELYGGPLALESIVITGGGHLNVDSGFGEWPDIDSLVAFSR